MSWSYDLAGRIVSLSDTAGHALTNAYDSAGRIVSTATAIPGLAAKTVAYAYDAAGNRTKLSWPDGYSVSYAYDAASRMLSALENGTTSLASFDYDQLGRPAAIRYAGDAANDVSLSWSGEGDLLTLAHTLAGATAYNVAFTDAYTPAHQIASSAISNGVYQFVPQISGTGSYVPDALNRYASITPAGGAATAIGYDLKGNLTSDGTFSFAYDAENKLMTAAKTGTSAAYGYDPLGRRDKKTVNGVATYFLSADAEEIAEYDGAGALLRRYVPGPGTDRPIAMVTAAGAKSFFHQDKTGSVIAMSDTAGNRVEGPYLYDSYGNGAPYTGVPFKYTGRRLDPETGLYYYRARYYSPPVGRFLQTDPIGYADGIDWYTYVGNDPTDKTDPSGNCVGPLAIPCAIALEDVITAAAGILAGVFIGKATGDSPNTHNNEQAPDQKAGTANVGKKAPPVPDKPVGENPRRGRTGGRTVSGPLTPEHGGTGDAGQDFDHLTGGTGKPNSDQGRPPGTQVGDNEFSYAQAQKVQELIYPEAAPSYPRLCTIHHLRHLHRSCHQMNDFSLEWLGNGSLASAIKVPIKKVSVPEMDHGMIFALNLWRVDGTAIKICSKMHDLDDREEVGVISIDRISPPLSDKIHIELPDYFLSVVGVEKLSVKEQCGVVADSGIAIQFLGNHELIVVSGRFPCSISVSGILGLSAPFEPEWPIEKYSRSNLLE